MKRVLSSTFKVKHKRRPASIASELVSDSLSYLSTYHFTSSPIPVLGLSIIESSEGDLEITKSVNSLEVNHFKFNEKKNSK